MSRYTLTHLADSTLLRDLRTLVSQDQATTALLIAHLAEVDARRLYAPAGYPSMYEWCVRELHFSEQSAFKRIRVSRLARLFPSIYGMLADGRLNLSAIVMLSAHLAPENADELLGAAGNQTKAGIEQLLAERFPQPDLPAFAGPVTPPMSPFGLSPGRVTAAEPEGLRLSPGGVASPPVPPVDAKLAPLAPQRFALQCTVGQITYEKLRYAQALLGHAVPSGELAQVLDRALDTLIAHLERQKFARTDRPRPRRVSEHARHIPADVKQAVWERDGGQCTFVGENGHRCDARTRLEFDHVEAVAQGGRATVQGLRLRCRAHNQYAAEQQFGRDFMNTKRESRGKQPLPEHAAEVIPYLRHLGMRPDEARRWAECCEGMPEASLEDRLRHALKCSARTRPKRVA
jgi:hypothetical protein